MVEAVRCREVQQERSDGVRVGIDEEVEIFLDIPLTDLSMTSRIQVIMETRVPIWGE